MTEAPPSSPLRDGARRLARAGEAAGADLVASLTPTATLGLKHLWDFWALPHQLPPEGDWRTWVILGGRGAGKTRAGAEWVRAQVEGPRPRDGGRARRVALLAETIDQAREVMVMGESGLLACSPPDRRPEWVATRRMLVWPNGATAQVFSAHDFESLRGPQFDCAWADELAKWKRGQDAWDMLQFGLRLGSDPRAVVTTTPRSAPVLRALLAQPGTVQTHAPTRANRANLAPGFLQEIEGRYKNTRLGRQEVEGVLLEDVEGAFWTPALLEAAICDRPPPRLDRVLVAVDPSVTGGKRSDACGIVVAGAVTTGPQSEWRAWVLEDATVEQAGPGGWAAAAVAALRRHGAHRVVAEVNQGGDLVGHVLRGVGNAVPYTGVRAAVSKWKRAEPVAMLYEQGRVRHAPGLGRLEEQLAAMTSGGYRGRGSPDRADALVWALHCLLVDPAGWAEPRVRGL